MKRTIAIVLMIVFALALTACAIEETDPTPQPPAAQATAAQPGEYSPDLLAAFQPLPAEVLPEEYQMTAEMVELGRMLFYEERISISQDMSCNSCHLLDEYGVDGLQFSLGHDGKPVGRNSPTVYNAALHASQFWDGREPHVEAQAQGPILAAGEMGMPNPDYVVRILKTIPGYAELFAAAFPGEVDPINYSNVGRAIGAFERGLLTPGPFDALLNGDESALDDQQKRGMALFVSTGCLSCHYGESLGGERFAVLGQAETYPGLTDDGRFAITGEETDRFSFKVPGLRNVAETGPYFHDGSVATLTEAVELMAQYQLARELNADEVADIVAFLESLTGEIPTDYIFVPEFPESGPDTPGPYDDEAMNPVTPGS